MDNKSHPFIRDTSLYIFTGQYKSLTRYVGSRFLYYLISRNSILILIIIIIGKFFNLSLPSGGNLIIFLILVSFMSGGIRFLLRDMLLYFSDFKKKKNLKKSSNIWCRYIRRSTRSNIKIIL